VRYPCPFFQLSSSTPIERIPSRLRCSKPHVTACSTARKTVSQLVAKRRAVSFRDRTFAQLARNQVSACVVGDFPVAQGIISATTPHLRHSTRPHRVHQEDGHPPGRDEGESPRRERVVAGSLDAAAAADRPRPGTRAHLDAYGGASTRRNKARDPVDETWDRLDAAEDSLELHLVGVGGVGTSSFARCASSPRYPAIPPRYPKQHANPPLGATVACGSPLHPAAASGVTSGVRPRVSQHRCGAPTDPPEEPRMK